MKIACATSDVAAQVVRVLNEHGVRRGVRWEGGSPLDERIWLFVIVPIDPATEPSIRRDIEAIPGATIQP